MKLGIITIHKAVNYGAVLQAVGLYQHLEKLHPGQCEIIDYQMNARQNTQMTFQPVQVSILQYRLRQLLQIKQTLARRKLRQRFQTFMQTYYRVSETTYNTDTEIASTPPEYDVYLSGSDQIFNLELTNQSKAFFLDFVQGKKKIAYSSSFGMGGLKEKYLDQTAEFLRSYDAISVRECSAIEPLQRLLAKKIIATCDPVFLLHAEEWIQKMQAVKTPKRYILVYAMSDNPNVHRTLRWLREKEKLPVVILKNGSYDLPVKGRLVEDAGPAEFLYWMKNATYVLTNSFHGTAFSVIFGKKFFCLEEEMYKADQRYAQMLHEAGIEDCVTPYDTDWGSFDFAAHLQDGQQAYDRLKPWIEASKNFLDRSITEEKE